VILLLGLLALLALPLRAVYDPFAPAAPGFPDKRLRRAGLDDETMQRLRDEYAGMDRDDQRQFMRFVSRNPDRSIAARYQGRRSREDLEHMTVDDELIPLLRERRLSTQGRKAELIERLLASYDAPSGALSADKPPARPDTPDEGPEAGRSSDTAGNDTPDAGQPATPAPATPSAPASAPSTQAPGPQTPDAEPAPATPASADTTTKEAPRG
jgi:hypothetical protein